MHHTLTQSIIYPYSHPITLINDSFNKLIAGIWSDIKKACIPLNNDKMITVRNIEECMESCMQATTFNCLSIEFNIAKTKNCHLSSINSTSSAYTEPCAKIGYLYAERL